MLTTLAAELRNEEEIRSQLRTVGLDYLTVEAVSDRHITAWGMKQ